MMSFQHITSRAWPVLLVALSVLLVACNPTPAGEQDKNWTEASGLLRTSDRILAARIVDTKLETVQLIDSATGAIAGEADVLFRQFEVSESFKGTLNVGDTLWVAFEPGQPGELLNGVGEVEAFVDEVTYVLFLKGRLRPLEYPAEYGAILWTGNGEPAFAELQEDRLEFWAESSYLQMLVTDGRSLPIPQSAAPFILTIEEVERGI